MTEKVQIQCEVAFALPHKQRILNLHIEQGTTAYQAVQLSEIEREFVNHDFAQLDLGVFAESIEHDYVVREGDRIEIYRPLTADPKEVRRLLAAQGKTMGAKK